MISVAHAACGAYIASVLPYPGVYIPLCLASHFALDYVRHYDVGVAMKKYHFTKQQIVFYESLDLLGAALVIILIWQQTPATFNLNLWIGALFAILPDIIEASDYFFGQPFWIFKPFYYLHERFHHSTSSFWWGTLPQIILVSTIALAVIWSR